MANDFKPALPKAGAWSLGDSQFDEGGKYIKLSLPLESVHEFCSHLMTMADDPSKQKTIKVWNFQTNKAEEVTGIIFTSKGKDGQYGPFGHINPAKIEVTDNGDF